MRRSFAFRLGSFACPGKYARSIRRKTHTRVCCFRTRCAAELSNFDQLTKRWSDYRLSASSARLPVGHLARSPRFTGARCCQRRGTWRWNRISKASLEVLVSPASPSLVLQRLRLHKFEPWKRRQPPNDRSVCPFEAGAPCGAPARILFGPEESD